MFHQRTFFVTMLSICIGIFVMSGCGAATSHPIAQHPTAIPTVTYLPPTVIPDTPAPATVSPATPTPVSSSLPAPTQHPSSATPTPHPTATPSIPQPPGGIPNISGQVIFVSIDHQWLWAYQNKQLVYNTPVTTGRPELPTPSGIYPMQYKTSNITFISPWPVSSPYYYSPEHIDYAFYFLYDGYYIHDAPWRTNFGPGTELPHAGAGGTQETGSHGCVEVPVSAGTWLYSWAQNGLTVDIVGTTPAPIATPTPTTMPATPTLVPTTVVPTPTIVPATVAPTPTLVPTVVKPTPTTTH